MQVSTKFTIAIHMLTAIKFFRNEYKITSKFLAGSIGSNRLIEVKRGPGGMSLQRPLTEITFLDVYRAVETASSEDLFRFHEKPNPKCPVGRHIHEALDGTLQELQQDFETDLAYHTVAEVYQTILADQ